MSFLAVKRILAPLLATLALLSAAGAAHAAEPALDIAFGGRTRHLTRAELLRLPALRTIEVADDAAYRHPMRYQALPLTALIPHPESAAVVQFTARDGFVANIPGKLLAGRGQPWLAVEPAGAPWPPLKPGGPSAGPFYLVWLAPRQGGVSPEQWPYQIARIAPALPLAQRYPQILPRTADAKVRHGLRVYAENCAACHRINGGGDAAVGPDLNRPFNPTEYFHEPFLRRLIRDPAAVRNWNRRAMPGFPPAALSDADLDALIAYLRQMAAQR